MTTPAPQSQPRPKKLTIADITLTPINLHDPAQYSEFHAQRIKCGWSNTPTDLEFFRTAVDRGERTLFWITVASDALPASIAAAQSLISAPTRNDNETNGHPDTTPPADAAQTTSRMQWVNAGHISLDTPTPHDAHALHFGSWTLNGTTMKISTLYLSHRFRGLGLARPVVDLTEALARRAPYGNPACACIVLDALSSKYVRQEGQEGRGIWARAGLPMRILGEGELCSQEMFEKWGYVEYKRADKYEAVLKDGSGYRFEAVFLRKDST